MLTGWSRQQRSRMLGKGTIAVRQRLVRRFVEFAESYPWGWGPGDLEDFTVSLMSGKDRLAISTIRSYHLTLRMFCDYLTDARYEWAEGVPRPLRSGAHPGLPRVEHGRPSQRIRGQPGTPPADLRRAADPLRLPRRPGGIDRVGGQEGLARGLA